MEGIRARVPWEFFRELYPFNAELLNAGAFLIRACGALPSCGDRLDGSIQRSKGYLLFGHGIATILPHARRPCTDITDYYDDGYEVELTAKRDPRGVTYWEVQPVRGQGQMPEYSDWRLKVSANPPDPDDEGHVRKLIEIEGDPGQYIFLSRPS